VKQQDFFIKILKTLKQFKIPYMISGSVGAMIWGEPRMTNDIDIIIEILPDQIKKFLDSFGKKEYYYPSVEFIEKAIIKRSQFNIIHIASGSKADLIIKKDSEFARVEFSRKQDIPFTKDFLAASASPEDIIISKMAFYKAGKSEKHLSDIVSMLKISGAEIDRTYLEDWVNRLNYQDTWKLIQSKI
jgi:hypothetical protein